MTANPQFLRDVKVYWGGYELAGFANHVELKEQAPLVLTPIFGDTGARRIGGPPQASLGMAGYFDGATIDVQLPAGLSTGNVPVSVVPEGETLGNTAMLLRALVSEYTPLTGPVDGVAGFTFSALGDAGLRVVKGQLLHFGTETVTDVETGVVVGAVAAGQSMYAALHVFSKSGTNPTLDVVLQSDTVGWPSATARITFAQKTAIGSEWKSVAGAITDTYWRASWTIGGADTPTFNFALVVGIL